MHHPTTAPAARADGWSCRRTALHALAGGLLLAAAPARARGRLCRLGVHPCLPALKLEAMMAGVAVELGQVLGCSVQIKSRPTFEEFRDELLSGSYDLVLVNPFLFVEAADLVGYLPLVRMADELRAELLTLQPWPVGDLRSLRGRSLALPPRLAAASFLTRAALLDAGLRSGRDVTLHHFPDQVSCLQAVSIGTVDACAALSFLRGSLLQIGHVPLRSAWTSGPVAGIVIAAHPRLPVGQRLLLREAMLGWNGSPKGKALLASLGWSGMATPVAADFEGVRTLDGQLRAADLG